MVSSVRNRVSVGPHGSTVGAATKAGDRGGSAADDGADVPDVGAAAAADHP